MTRQRSITLNPKYATAHQWYGEHLSSMGRYDEALAELKRAQELDPLSLIINAVLGVTYGLSGQPDQAIDQLRKTLEMDPNFARTHFIWRKHIKVKECSKKLPNLEKHLSSSASGQKTT